MVFGAFALGYAIFMLPSGRVADLWGPRKFLAVIVMLWSLFTLQTGLVSALGILVAVRFLFGAAEAGAYPAAARALYNWLPARERGLGLGLLNTGSRLGAAVGLMLVSYAIAVVGWRTSFILLGAFGLAWAAWWIWWFRDEPAAKRGVPPAELEVISAGRSSVGPVQKPDWRELISWNSVLILTQYFASNFTFFICFSWLLPYLRTNFRLTGQQAGIYASIPLYCGALATWMSGSVVDVIFRRGHWALSRRLPAVFGFTLAVVTLLAAAHAGSPLGFVACFALTTFGVDFTLSPSWSISADVGKRQTGTLSGAMNTLGSVGSFLSSITFPWLLGLTGSVKAYFFLAAALDVIAVLCWLRIRPDPPTSRSA
jgi:ACS family glucarate transporter-like MFS transporter